MFNIKRWFFFTGNMIFIFLVTGFLKTVIIDSCVGKIFTDSNSFLSLVLVKNNGAAFNLFAGFNDLLILFATAIIFFCMVYVLMYKLYIPDNFLFLMSIFCAGILGNAYERYMYDYVTDYIKVSLFNFPVFNLYDILITVGAISIALVIVADKRKEMQEIQDAEEDDLFRDL